MISIYVITAWLTTIIASCVGIFVYLKNPKREINKRWAFMNLCIAFWSLFLGLLFGNSKDAKAGLIYSQILMVGANLIPITFYHFILAFLDLTKDTKQKKLLFIGYIVTFFILLVNFTPLFIKSASYKSLAKCYYPNAGPFFIFYILLYFGLTGYACFLMYQTIKISRGQKKNQIKYAMFASVFGFLDGATTFPLWYQIQIPPFGSQFVWLYTLILTYAILKYRLMDIKVAVTRAGIFAVVYILVLGLPFVVIKWLKPILIPLLGENWWIAILVFGMALASAGPFIYLFLQRHAENILLKEQRRYQQALRELSKTMTRFRDLDKLLQAIVLTVIEQVKISFAGIYLKDEEYKSCRLKHCFPPKEKPRFPEFIPLDANLIKILYQHKKPLLSEEIGQQDKINLDSGLVIPCFIEDDLLGFLVLGAKPNNQMYTSDDLIVFETLSYSTSLAIENSQFWKEIEEHQRQARIQEMDLFSYSLAHEIDNPMNNIKTVARYLKDYFLKELNLPLEKQKEIESGLNSILGSQERVSGMVKAIEEFGKPITGEFGPLRLEDVLKNYLDLYLPEFKYHGIFFTKELPEKIPYIRGIKQELMQILANFSNNSIHALLATKEKKIHLKIEVPNSDFIRIIFSDNGYGITEEKIRSIFAPFVTTKASTEGKGMGLYTIRRIIEKHKGKVWAESEGKGKGTTFIVELPIAKDVTEEDFKKEDRGKRLF